jgi:hypothetical protein
MKVRERGKRDIIGDMRYYCNSLLIMMRGCRLGLSGTGKGNVYFVV